MKNKGISIAVLLMLVLTLTLPVFAETEEVPASTPAETATEEVVETPASEPEKAPAEEVKTEQPEAEKDNASDSGEKKEETAEDSKTPSEEPVAPEEKVETIKEGKITIVCKGNGKAELKDGKIICIPDNENEIISITADKKIGDVIAGQQLSEDALVAIDIEDGTTITIVFEKCYSEEPIKKAPASATAIFCGPAE